MTKRGNGEGSIFRRKDERWSAAVDLGWQGGKRRRKTVYGKTRGEVAEKLAVALRAKQQGLPATAERLTVAEFLNRWLTDSVEPRLRPRTAHGYRIIAEHHLIPVLGRIPLTKLTPDAVQVHLNGKLAEGLSISSVRGHRAVLRAALMQALRWELVTRNVASLVSLPSIENAEVKPFSTAEARRFLDVIHDDRFESLYAITLALGLRQGEALALTWSDIDFTNTTLTVSKTLQRYSGSYHLDEPKTKRSHRTIAMPGPVLEALRRQRTRQLEMRLRAGAAWRGNEWDLVFTTEAGEPISGSVVTHQFQALLKEAGLPRQRFHDLRHAAASFMLAQGVPLRAAMEVLGHSEIAVTANTYSHVAPEVQREAVERVSQLLWSTS